VPLRRNVVLKWNPDDKVSREAVENMCNEIEFLTKSHIDQEKIISWLISYEYDTEKLLAQVRVYPKKHANLMAIKPPKKRFVL